ncbi:MAG: metalloregulator ArsR/SmtB family transcription factor [Acetobacteraceae bacterium]|nr:metalloregulator ArsR/SmtB family transcription factor [Acetobacteraceae bacterium]
MSRDLLSAKADLLKALAHPTRLEILEVLRSGERCVCEIVPRIGHERSSVSKHLAVLRRLGVLGCRKEGLRVMYWLRHPRVAWLLDAAGDVLADEARRFHSLVEGRPSAEGPASGPGRQPGDAG